ncbi:hypothetical protein MMC25_003603 [Agyrium rufum]|nr:hypothetical protein [Agyrium rufum]
MLCFDRPLTSITFSISLLLLASQIISANAGTTLITTILLTSTASAPPSSPTNPPQYTSPSLFQSSILNSTNFYRTQHNATSLTWNTTLATYAQSYSSSCTFKHSGGPYGENLAEGYANATSSVEASGDERKGYDFAKPGFSEATGHFTQLVWRDTRSTGCGRTFCDGRGGVSGWFVPLFFFLAALFPQWSSSVAAFCLRGCFLDLALSGTRIPCGS